MVGVDLADWTAGCGWNGVPRSVVGVVGGGGGVAVHGYALLNVGVVVHGVLLVVVVL